MNTNTHRNLIETIDHIALNEQILPTSSLARMGKRYVDIKKSRTPDNPLGERPVDFEKNFPNLAATDEFDDHDRTAKRGYAELRRTFPPEDRRSAYRSDPTVDTDWDLRTLEVARRKRSEGVTTAKKYGLPVTRGFDIRPKDKDIEKEKRKYFSTGYVERNPEASGVKPKKPYIPGLGGR